MKASRVRSQWQAAGLSGTERALAPAQGTVSAEATSGPAAECRTRLDPRGPARLEETKESGPRFAKISPPRSRHVLARKRLFARIDAARTHRALWITGPPGAGKTTLASSYIQERKLRALWYQLDEGDADIASFFHYLGLSIKALAPRYRKPLPPLTPEYLPGLLTFTRRFFETLSQRLGTPAVIVLDDYHEVAAEAPLHEVVREAAESLPSGLSLLVLSRSDPPAALARLRLHGELVRFGWEDLQLTLDEAHGIAALSGPQAEVMQSHIAELHGQTQGWVAGLLLLLERGENFARGALAPHLDARSVLFDYFATEIFGRLAPSTRAPLLCTAFLRRITARQAERLTGDHEVGRVLADLERRNCFVVQRQEAEPIYAEPIYEVHPLFRDFLLERAHAAFDEAALVALQRRAAELLDEAGQPEEAAPLYHAARDWHALSSLVLRHAPALVAQGRHRTLGQWLCGLPSTLFEHTPWLCYWQGMAHLPFAPVTARGPLEEAYLQFKTSDDAVGLYSAWAGIMDTFFFEWRDLKPADRWIAELEGLRLRHPEFPSRTVELRTYLAMGTLLHRQPQHPILPAWSERALLLLDQAADHDLSVLLGGYLVIYFLWWGDAAKAWEVIERLATRAHAPHVSPMVYILWSCAVALYHSVHGDQEACLKSVEDGLARARRTGLHCWDFLLSAQAVRGSLVAGDLASASTWMSAMANTMRSHSHIDGAFYGHLLSNAAAQREDWHEAVEHARSALAMAIEAGAPFVEAHCRIDLARALLGRSDDREWTKHLRAARTIGRAMGSPVLEYHCFETEAQAAFQHGQYGRGLNRLAEALALSRGMGGATWLLAGPRVSARLYDRALAAGIEVDHVERLIRRRRLTPPDPTLAADHWPWPVKVYTLGRFDLIVDGAPLHVADKGQKKPLELLMALIALGGRQVPQTRLADLLWPDAEGDAAYRALITTLQRLRRFIGEPRAITFHDGCLSLDGQQMWVDAWAFERALGKTAEPQRQDGLSNVERALRLYNGPFLRQIDHPWVVAPRERLRAKYLQHLLALGRAHEAEGRWEEAHSWYRRGIEADELVEAFYQRLIRCYQHLGRTAEARATGERCRRVLAAALGTPPSAEPLALIKTLGL